MTKRENNNKLIKLNIAFQIVMSVNIVIIILILTLRKSYRLNLTIIGILICILNIFIAISVFKILTQRFVLKKCDYISNLLYLEKMLKYKTRSEKVIIQIDFVNTYLMLGMYHEAKEVLNKLNEKISGVNTKYYIHIYLLNLKYLAESGDEDARKEFIEQKWNIEEYLGKLSKKRYVLSSIKIWEAIIDKNWETVIHLIKQMVVVDEASRVVFTYWYAIANKKIGNMDIANEHFTYVKVHGKNTIYAEYAEREDSDTNLQQEQSIVKSKSWNFDKIICFIYVIIWISCFALWYTLINFNKSTDMILKKYNFTVNQQEIEKIYSETYDDYVYEIFVDPKVYDGRIYKIFLEKEIFYYCIFKKEGKYYRLLNCYVSDINEMQEYKNLEGYLDSQELDKVKVADMKLYVRKYARLIKKFGEKVDYEFPYIGVYNDERIKDVEIEGKLPEIKKVKIQENDWYIWMYQ